MGHVPDGEPSGREPSLFRRVLSGQAGLWAAPIRAALALGELAYGAVIRRRNARYDREGPSALLPVPVVSVGNLTVGGTGKTPMVVHLVGMLQRMGFRPAVVARGYRAPRGAPNDEQVLIERRCPGVSYRAAPDRLSAATAAFRDGGADVIVLDDGFQHRRIGRKVDIVLIDATRPFGYGRLLPRGLLREPPAGLRRAHVVVLTRVDQAGGAEVAALLARVRELAPDALHVMCRHRVTAVETLDGRPAGEALAGKRAVLVAGIAHPAAFRATVHSLGVEVVAQRCFPDHHRYRERDLRSLDTPGALPPHDVCVTTEKDAVKLVRLAPRAGRPFLVVRVDIEFLHDGEGLLDTLLDRELHKGRLLS
jgi:tetraacyldisaccharide 4'-kinase